MEHPKLKQLKEKKQEIKKLEQELYIEQTEDAKTLKAKYKRIVIYDKDNKTLRIKSILTNKNIFDAHMYCFGSIYNAPKEEKLSVDYYRINKVLLHKGGGWLSLKDEQPCSDDEWAKIITGDIPEKFLY